MAWNGVGASPGGCEAGPEGLLRADIDFLAAAAASCRRQDIR